MASGWIYSRSNARKKEKRDPGGLVFFSYASRSARCRLHHASDQNPNFHFSTKKTKPGASFSSP